MHVSIMPDLGNVARIKT